MKGWGKGRDTPHCILDVYVKGLGKCWGTSLYAGCIYVKEWGNGWVKFIIYDYQSGLK